MEDVEMYYIEKIKNHLLNWTDYVKIHLVRFVFIALLLICSCFLLTLFPKSITSEGEQQILIFDITISNWSIWLGILGIGSAAIWALYQFDKTRISSQQEKASDIAKIFSDGLLLKCGILIAVFDNSPLKPIIDEIDKLKQSFSHFTTDELREIIDDDDFPSAYKRNKKMIDFDYIYYRILEKRITTDLDYKEKYSNEKEHYYTTKEAQDLFILDNQGLPFHFSALIDDVLNSLEHICMSISSHAAGSTFIYQSLHQMFFDTIKVLALEISSRNDGKYSDKFYTNIIHVYNEWKELYTKSTINEKNKKDLNKKILNPKIKTVE